MASSKAKSGGSNGFKNTRRKNIDCKQWLHTKNNVSYVPSAFADSQFNRFALNAVEPLESIDESQPLNMFVQDIRPHVSKGGHGVTMIAYGRTERGDSAAMRINGFWPHFSIAIPSVWVKHMQEHSIPKEKMALEFRSVFTDAVSEHIADNPRLAKRFAKHEGNFFVLDESKITDDLEWKKDCYGYSPLDVRILLLKIRVVDPALIPVCRNLLLNPKGVPDDRCAICLSGFGRTNHPNNPDLQMSWGHRGSCRARYHKSCIETWFESEKRRGHTYKVDIAEGEHGEAIEQLEHAAEDVISGADETNLHQWNELGNGVVRRIRHHRKIFNEQEAKLGETSDKDSSGKGGMESWLGLDRSDKNTLEDLGSDGNDRVTLKEIHESSDENTEVDETDQPTVREEDGITKECNSCPCCLNAIFVLRRIMPYEKMHMRHEKWQDDFDVAAHDSSTSLDNWLKIWNRRVARFDWPEFPPPEPTDLFGEEEFDLAGEYEVMRPRPRFTCYEANIDVRVRFMVDYDLHPSSWWHITAGMIQRQCGRSDERRLTTLHHEFVVNCNNVRCVQHIIKNESSKQEEHPLAYLLTKQAALTVASIDLEMEPGPNGEFCDVEKDRILQCGALMYNELTKEREYVLFTVGDLDRSDSRNRQFFCSTTTIECQDEPDMLMRFARFMQVVRPDTLIGWNINAFDIPYFVERCRLLGIQIGKYFCSRKRYARVTWKEGNLRSRSIISPTIEGVFVLDGMRYCQESFGSWRGFKLNDAAKILLHMSKLDMDYRLIRHHQKSARGRTLIAKYLRRDIELPLEIFIKIKAITTSNAFAQATGAPAQELTCRGTQFRMQPLLMHKYKEYGRQIYGCNVAIPTLIRREKANVDGAAYQGAFVFPPKRGFYGNTATKESNTDDELDRSWAQVANEAIDKGYKARLQSLEDDPLLFSNKCFKARRAARTAKRKMLREYFVGEYVSNRYTECDKTISTRQLKKLSRYVTTWSHRPDNFASTNGDVVATLDYSSLYPTVMIQHNLCTTTLVTEHRLKKHGLHESQYPFVHSMDIKNQGDPTCDKSPFEKLIGPDGKEFQLHDVFPASGKDSNGNNVFDAGVIPQVWRRPDFDYTKHGIVRVLRNPDNPMFVIKDVLDGVVPKIERLLGELRTEYKGYKKKWEKAVANDENELRRMRSDPTVTQDAIVVQEKKLQDSKDLFDLYDINQVNVKLVMNSLYGYYGARESMLPNQDMAETITLCGRYATMIAKIVAETVATVANGYHGNCKVIYGDTDSIFIWMDTKYPWLSTKSFMMDLGRMLSQRINHYLHRLQKLVLEKVFEDLLLINPKNYVGIKFEDTGKTSKSKSGVRSKRRDSNRLQAMLFDRIMELLTSADSVYEVLDAVGDILEKLYRREVPIHWLSTSGSFTKDLDDPDARPSAVMTVARKKRDRTGERAVPGIRYEIVILEGAGKWVRIEVPNKAPRYQYQVPSVTERAEDPNYALKHDLPYDAAYYMGSTIRSVIKMLVYVVPSVARSIARDDKDIEEKSTKWLMNYWFARPVYKKLHKQLAEHSDVLTKSIAGSSMIKVPRCVKCRARIPTSLQTVNIESASAQFRGYDTHQIDAERALFSMSADEKSSSMHDRHSTMETAYESKRCYSGIHEIQAHMQQKVIKSGSGKRTRQITLEMTAARHDYKVKPIVKQDSVSTTECPTKPYVAPVCSSCIIDQMVENRTIRTTWVKDVTMNTVDKSMAATIQKQDVLKEMQESVVSAYITNVEIPEYSEQSVPGSKDEQVPTERATTENWRCEVFIKAAEDTIFVNDGQDDTYSDRDIISNMHKQASNCTKWTFKMPATNPVALEAANTYNETLLDSLQKWSFCSQCSAANVKGGDTYNCMNYTTCHNNGARSNSLLDARKQRARLLKMKTELVW